jgi:O-methyltransferase
MQAAELYLDLLKRVLTRSLFEVEVRPVNPHGRLARLIFEPVKLLADAGGMQIVRRLPIDPAVREVGGDWPGDAETMIGLRRLDNLHELILSVLEDGVPGDFLEAGAWRGGASIFARAALDAYGDRDRCVWVADSFQGLPKPSLTQDEGDAHWTFDQLAVSLEEVRGNFARYGMLNDRVRFLEGWFKDTLPVAPIDRLSILRLDGDMYESTMDGLVLYDKVSAHGYVIIDDYSAVEGCKRAVDEFRRARAIAAPLEQVDGGCVYWRKP